MTNIKERYLIIGFPRSGTTVVHLKLMHHPNISAMNDELKVFPFFSHGISSFTFGNDTESEKKNGHIALFDAMTTIEKDDNTRIIGAKTCPNCPAQAHAIKNALRSDSLKNIKIIYTKRNDLVAQFASLLRAKKIGQYHSWIKKEQPKKIKIKINRVLFARYLLNCFETHEILDTLQKTHSVIEFHYESLLQSQEKPFEEVFSFFDLTDSYIGSGSKKVAPPAKEYVSNYDQMVLFTDKLKSCYDNNSVPLMYTLIKKIGNYISKQS